VLLGLPGQVLAGPEADLQPQILRNLAKQGRRIKLLARRRQGNPQPWQELRHKPLEAGAQLVAVLAAMKQAARRFGSRPDGLLAL
jgi:hypothetical protein